MNPRRKRQQHGSRSRTGCRTCRARRVKCDETPGKCGNCTSTGRPCEGYEVYRLPLPGGPKTKRGGGPPLTPAAASGFCWVVTSDERRCFAFFCDRTIRDEVAFYDSARWACMVLDMANTEPAVCHAVIALGAAHQETVFGGMQSPLALTATNQLAHPHPVSPRPSEACKDFTVRWRTLQALRSWPHNEGAFDSLVVSTVLWERFQIELKVQVATDLRSLLGSDVKPKEFDTMVNRQVEDQLRLITGNEDRELAQAGAYLSHAIDSDHSMKFWTCVGRLLNLKA